MHAVALAVAVVWVSCAAATPDGGGNRLFPLQAANEWTYKDLRYGGSSTMTVGRARNGVSRLEGFPGAPDLRVRFAGQNLQAWDREQRRWETLLRLGAAKGTTYGVDLPEPLWEGVQVTVASRSATVRNPVLRRSHAGTVRLAVRPPAGLSDAGVTGLWFAPGIGLVRWVEESIAGPTVHVLASARIGKRSIG